MISFYSLMVIVWFHWFFDFALQTHSMAMNKSKCNEALAQHVFVYSGGLLFMGALNCLSFKSFAIGMVWVLLNAIAHFITDWVTSRASSALYKEEKYHDFFVCIGTDQALHYTTLIVTFVYFTSL